MSGLLNLDSTASNNGNNIVDLFAEYFSNVYCNSQKPLNFPYLNIASEILNLNSFALTELNMLNILFPQFQFYSNVPDGIYSVDIIVDLSLHP